MINVCSLLKRRAACLLNSIEEDLLGEDLAGHARSGGGHLVITMLHCSHYHHHNLFRFLSFL